LAQQETKYRETFENAPEAIFWFTRGKIVEANRAFCELIGYSQQELVRMSPGNFMIHEEQSKNRLLIDDLWARREDRVEIEHRIIRKDGSVVWVRTWTGLASNDSGEPWLAVSHVQDITAQREADEALEQREKLYRHLVEESLQGVAIAATGGKPLFVNEVFAKMYGYSVDEFLAIDSTITLFHPGEWPRLKSYTAGREAGEEEVRRYEIRSVRKDGSVFWTEQMSSSVQWSGQRATQIVSIDITERKIAETALKEREQRYRSLVDNSLQGILVTREKIQFANDALCRMFGYTAEELCALPSVFDCYHPDDHERVREAAQARQRGDDAARTFEFRGVRKDGSVFWMQQMSSLIEWQGETAAQIVVIDITERKNAEQRLAQSESQYRETFENAPVAMAWVSNDDDFLATNRAFQNLLGYTSEELSHMKRTDVVHVQFAEKRERDMKDLFENRIDREVSEVRLVRKDKTLLWALVSTCVIRDEHGNSRFIIGHLQDITAHKAAEEQLFQAQKMDALGNLAGGIAHDFNNMLLPIIAMTELTKGEIPLDSPAQENLSMVLEAATQASQLVKQILTFSRQDERELSDIEISSCVSETLKLMRNVLPSSITVIDRVDNEVGVIVGDRAQLQSVMMNLASNAVDAMDGKVGTLTVALNHIVADHRLAGRRDAVIEGEPYVKITMEDSGCGMDQKTLEKIFNPFFTTKPVGEGTGLGLAMVHGIIESFKGVIEVSSEIGVGTVFELYLPLSNAGAAAATSTTAGETVLAA
jgi:PAS domain S-box-containing protein